MVPNNRNHNEFDNYIRDPSEDMCDCEQAGNLATGSNNTYYNNLGAIRDHVRVNLGNYAASNDIQSLEGQMNLLRNDICNEDRHSMGNNRLQNFDFQSSSSNHGTLTELLHARDNIGSFPQNTLCKSNLFHSNQQIFQNACDTMQEGNRGYGYNPPSTQGDVHNLASFQPSLNSFVANERQSNVQHNFLAVENNKHLTNDSVDMTDTLASLILANPSILHDNQYSTTDTIRLQQPQKFPSIKNNILGFDSRESSFDINAGVNHGIFDDGTEKASYRINDAKAKNLESTRRPGLTNVQLPYQNYKPSTRSELSSWSSGPVDSVKVVPSGENYTKTPSITMPTNTKYKIASSIKDSYVCEKDDESLSSMTVSYVYQDFSRYVDAHKGTTSDKPSSDDTSKKGPMKSHFFPSKLSEILSKPEFSSIIQWCPHGRAWRVVQPKKLEECILPTFFRHSNLSSFMRQVNGWGFRRLNKGYDQNAYFHELFLKGFPDLLGYMRRQTLPDLEPRDEPDFYSISENIPLPTLQSEFLLLNLQRQQISQMTSNICETDENKRVQEYDTMKSDLTNQSSSDFNSVSDQSSRSISSNRMKSRTLSIKSSKHFPIKLHTILARPDLFKYIGWSPSGKSWKVFKPKAFAVEVLPQYFQHCHYNSFMRQVNAWGFKRINEDPEMHYYTHPMFEQDKPELCLSMKRVKRNETNILLSKNETST